MKVQITPVAMGRRLVQVDGMTVGEIVAVDVDRWHHCSGTLWTGVRWLPVGISQLIDGPHTPADAALLLCALAWLDREAVVEASYGRAA